MKNTTKLMITTAVLAISAGIASAQSLKADIPFSFQAGSRMLPAGEYTVRMTGTHGDVVVFRNAAAKETAIVLPAGTAYPSKEWKAAGNAVLSFECGTTRCALTRMWTGESVAYTFRYSRPAGVERASITEVRLTRATE